ncbi:MAG TPA: ABC transporter permease, partial [Thermoanaerobaculia bacterium]|nr:ABC transporter permease [Thermoanaerobaculia bacterium]
QGARASADLFTVLGVNAAHGRLFRAGEDRPGAEPTIILSHGLWERAFGADPKVVGTTVRLDGETRTVVGVLEANAEFPDTAELWVPLTMNPQQVPRDRRTLVLLGRLAAGVSLEQASRQAADVAGRLATAYPETNQRFSLRAITLLEARVGRFRQLMAILFTVVGFVLLLACANVANLLLQRAVVREREMVLRIVLGAGRSRLIRLMLLETASLALLGAAVGLAVARWLTTVVVQSIPFPLPPWVRFELSPPVLAFAVATALLVALLLGLLPATRYARQAGAGTLAQEGVRSGISGERKALRSALVVTQVAVAFILLIGATLMVRSFQRLQVVDPGFDPRGRLWIELPPLPEARYAVAERRADFYQRAIDRLAVLPGVRGAAAISHAPLRGSVLTGFQVEGKALAAGERPPLTGLRIAQGPYLSAMGLPVLQGRDLVPSDTAGTAPAAVISQHMAQAGWPDQNPLGKRFQLEADGGKTWWTVVGVTRDVLFSLTRPAGNDVYVSYRQWPSLPLHLVVAAAGDPLAVAGAVRGALRGVDADLAVDQVETLRQVVDSTIWYQRLSARLLSVFALFALLLAVVGIYGSMSYSVSQRTHEIGVRMALGAQVADALRLVVRDGVRVTAIGIGIGLFGATILTGALHRFLYQIHALDLASFLGVAVVLLAIAVVASYLPARRVARIDPLSALRNE